MPHIGCPCKCSFCNQNAITGKLKPANADDVFSAVKLANERISKSPETVQIAFFGGSFTAIPKENMTALLAAAKTEVDRLGLGGIRISTRPDKIDENVLEILKCYGVTAIELGAQSMCDEVLQLNKRGHTAKQVEEASKLIKAYGFELGLQMMTGLLGDTDENAVQTAEKIIELRPETVRIYPTIIFEKTYLHELWQEGKYKPQTLEEAVSICSVLIEMFEKENIKIIRTGLHADSEMQNGFSSGPFHPAFKELCMSRIFYNKLLEKLSENKQKNCVVRVNPKSISVALGQKKTNLQKLKDNGFDVKFIQDKSINEGEFLIDS